MDKILCDTDILSSLAKARSLNILEVVFPKGKFIITENVREELQESIDSGFKFPERIFKICETTIITKEELKKYKSSLPEKRNLKKRSKKDTSKNRGRRQYLH